MQVLITANEKQTLNDLAAPLGRVLWICNGAGISAASVRRLRREGQADEDVVRRLRSFLKSKEAKKLIEQSKLAAA